MFCKKDNIPIVGLVECWKHVVFVLIFAWRKRLILKNILPPQSDVWTSPRFQIARWTRRCQETWVTLAGLIIIYCPVSTRKGHWPCETSVVLCRGDRQHWSWRQTTLIVAGKNNSRSCPRAGPSSNYRPSLPPPTPTPPPRIAMPFRLHLLPSGQSFLSADHPEDPAKKRLASIIHGFRSNNYLADSNYVHAKQMHATLGKTYLLCG